MAAFLLKTEHGSAYTRLPAPASSRTSCALLESGSPDWIEQLSAEGVTAGC